MEDVFDDHEDVNLDYMDKLPHGYVEVIACANEDGIEELPYFHYWACHTTDHLVSLDEQLLENSFCFYSFILFIRVCHI